MSWALRRAQIRKTERADTLFDLLLPEGIRYVLVNGQIALENGTEAGVLAGRVCSQTWTKD